MPQTKMGWIAVLMLMSVAAVAQEEKKEPPQREREPQVRREGPQRPLNAYELRLVLRETEDGKPANVRTYNMNLVDQEWGRLRAGSRVPLQTGTGLQYMDVGLNFDCMLSERDGRVLLQNTLEMSSVAAESGTASPPVTRNMKYQFPALIATGTPVVIGAIDDVVTRRRLQIEVTVHRQK